MSTTNERQDPTGPFDKPFWREHPAIIVTGGYVYLITYGMVFNFNYYRAFGVNIFDFVELPDFLIAAARDQWAIGLGVVAAFVWGVFYAVFVRPLKYALARAAILATILFLLLHYIYGYSSAIAPLRALENAPVVDAHLKAVSKGSQSRVERNVKLIGTTQGFAFFVPHDYKFGDPTPVIVPLASIYVIEPAISASLDDDTSASLTCGPDDESEQ